ncbi:MAG: coenzyme F420-dependent N10-methylene tetrahydromethanopterin reductase and related [Thermoleophilia bacterium]|nr:coenzyme F420-dependent N10-methylene tetrahydromethanopterin reductase and related [Thermoleophilia bacterium]
MTYARASAAVGTYTAEVDEIDLRAAERPDALTGRVLTPAEQGPGNHLRRVHDMYRGELELLERVTQEVRGGSREIGEIRATLHQLALKTNIEQFGALCARYCQMVDVHHRIESHHMFPAVRTAGAEWSAVVDQLEHEHDVIHLQLRRLDEALVALHADASHLERVVDEVGVLAEILRSHFGYEETQLAEPLGILGLGI